MLARISENPAGDHDRHAVEIHPGRLRSLWEMLENYAPVYKIALHLENLRGGAAIFRHSRQETTSYVKDNFRLLLEALVREGPIFGFCHTAELAQAILDRHAPETDADLLTTLNLLNDSLINELGKEGVLRVPPERTAFYDRDHLFGRKVSIAFPSCQRDILRAGSCYALAQEDACVHHLMLVLERGLNALATKVGVTFHYADWQKLIGLIEAKMNSGMPRGPELDFYRHVNAQFGFLKEAYRKHSAHARDDPYDMPKALSIFNHVKEFMQEIEKGGLKE